MRKIFFIILLILFFLPIAHGQNITSYTLIQYSNNTQRLVSFTTPTLLSNITVNDNYTGSWIINFDLSGTFTTGARYGYGQIYKNGVPYGTLQSKLSNGFETKSETFINISIINGDIIQLYAYSEQSGASIAVQNFRIMFLNQTNLTLNSPANNSNVTSPVTLSWLESPLNNKYTYQISTDSTFLNIINSGEVNNNSDPVNTTVYLDSGTYYWHVKNSTGSYTDWFNFTINTTPPVPGRFNISVFDEQNTSLQILNYSVQLYNSTNVVVKNSNTTSGWTNFSTEIASGEYLIVVIPNGTFVNYYQRMVLANSPGNVTMYVPNGTGNTINNVAFSLYDLTSLFPYQTSTISIYKGGLLQDKSYFNADGTHPVYLIQGTKYKILIQNGSNIFIYENYVPIASGTSQITTSNFAINTSNINPFTFNITSVSTAVTLNWNDANVSLNSLNYTVHKGDPMTLQCQLTTTIKHGQSVCTIDNTTVYHVIFSANITDGTFKNQTMYIDYRVGTRQNSTGISTIDGNATGIGFVWNYGTFVMPNWVYNWISVILVIVLFGSFGARDAGFGAIVGSVVLLIFEGVGWFRPIDNDATQALVMGLSVALLVFSIVYFMQHKDRGG